MSLNPEDHIQYKIVSALDQSMALDCVVDNDNPVITYKWHSGSNQRWKIFKEDNDKFKFVNQHNAKILSSPQQNSSNFLVTCKKSRKSQSQLWKLVPCEFNQFRNKRACFFIDYRGLAMDISGGKVKNCQKVSVYQQHKNKKVKDMLNQIFFIQPLSLIPCHLQEYKIFSAQDYNLVLDACQATQNYASIILYPCHKGANQRFFIQSYKGKYIFINKQHSFSLRVVNSSDENQAKIAIERVQHQNCQLWDLIPCPLSEYKGKQAFYIRSHCGKYLDISNGKAIQGAQLIQWHYNGQRNQIWYVHKL